MDFHEYQKLTAKTAIYPKGDKLIKGDILALLYLTISLPGETGEFCNKIKKFIRGDEAYNNGHDMLTPKARIELEAEVGDILWYLSELSSALGLDFSQVAYDNIQKLQHRKTHNTLRGDGDER